jgi:hypothetical protein
MPRFLVALLRFSHSHSHSLRITLTVSGFTQAFSVLEHSLFTSKGKSTGMSGRSRTTCVQLGVETNPE